MEALAAVVKIASRVLTRVVLLAVVIGGGMGLLDIAGYAPLGSSQAQVSTERRLAAAFGPGAAVGTVLGAVWGLRETERCVGPARLVGGVLSGGFGGLGLVTLFGAGSGSCAAALLGVAAGALLGVVGAAVPTRGKRLP